jgi:large subunit ribosomal protein L21
MKDYEKMTVKELSDELTSLGIPFKKKSRKAELIELLQAETKEKGTKKAEKEESVAPKTKSAPKEKTEKKAAQKPKSAKPSKSEKKAKAEKETSVYSGYAIVRTGGKQYQVSAGTLLRVEKIAGNVGDSVELNEVLALVDGDQATIGQPIVEGAVVTAKIVEQDKAKKVLVFKKKRRKGYRVKRGHRQMYTALKVSDISI